MTPQELLTRIQQGFATLPVDAALRERALTALRPWILGEDFADYRPQLQSLVDQGRFETLFDMFWQVIPFGTGGRRGSVGIGSNRFNSWTLGTSVQGHAELLRERYPDEEVAVVIAFDVRVYRDVRGVGDPARPNPLLGLSSADFAAHAAGVYAANGVRVHLLDPAGGQYMSTPELSLAIRRLGAHGGLNVSASHNPPDDNGGKFYNREGGQDVPPDDEILAQRVEGITRVRRIDFDKARAEGWVTLIDERRENAHYLAVNRRLALLPEARGGRIVFTALNGTGSRTVGRLLAAEGFDLHVVPEQDRFDGAFPTVKFRAPNPEVPDCFEQAEAVADACGADIILATDPDADRIGLEVRDAQGGWRFVHGNEILFLVTRFVLDRRRDLGRLPPDAFVLKTEVTSSLVSTIARSYGCQVVGRLLVGFKYMAEVLAELELHGAWHELRARPESFVIGVEESHGLLLTPAVRDKDAGGPALALAELNAHCRAQGRTILDELNAIYARFGYVSNRLVNTVMSGSTGITRIREIQASLRADPPSEIGGRRVVSFQDLASESSWLGPIRSGTDAAARNVLVFELEDGSRAIIRPSGTEPKNKIYVEVPGTTPARDLTPAELAVERERCDTEAARLGRVFERLMLARVGIELPDWALAVSGLVNLEQKRQFAGSFVPELERRAGRGEDLRAFVDEHLRSYGSDPRDLVAPGVAAWLTQAQLPAASAERVRAAFGLPH